jgi:GAF domain-containing protein
VYEEPGPALAANFDSLNEALLEEDFYTDEYGEFLSGYAPIFNSEGESVGVLGVDITANTIRQRETAYLFRLIGLYLLALPLLVFFGVLAADYLAKPIVGLRDMANRIKDGDFSTRITNIPNTRELAELAVDLNLTADNLDGLITDLEKRVADRTEGLTKRTEQLRTAAYIARQTADIQDLYSILETVVNLITDRFGFYHAGIFLMNESANEVVLQAASSEGGKRMLLRGHSLVVGSQGIVGYVASQKRTRIALDVGVDAVFFNNPDLPMTRSEVALPLLIRNRVLGVLDIQSDQPQAFHEEDLDVLQTLADQVAVAIDNARLLGEAQAALMQLETVSAIRTREAWAQRLEYQSRGYTYTPLGLRAETSSSEETKNRITTSITLRGQKIGSLSLAKSENEEWNKLDQNLITEVAYQIGLAVDNLRLLEDAQQRARQEQIIGELSTRFSQSLDIDTLLQTAARELGQLPDVDEVSVFIGEMPSTTTRQQTKRTTG